MSNALNCSYPDCGRQGVHKLKLFWRDIAAKEHELEFGVCSMHNTPLCRSTAKNHAKQRAIRKAERPASPPRQPFAGTKPNHSTPSSKPPKRTTPAA